jgi:hypothetical protein
VPHRRDEPTQIAAVPVVLASHPGPSARTYQPSNFFLEQRFQAGSDGSKEKGTEIKLNVVLGRGFNVANVDHGELLGSPAKGRPFGVVSPRSFPVVSVDCDFINYTIYGTPP